MGDIFKVNITKDPGFLLLAKDIALTANRFYTAISSCYSLENASLLSGFTLDPHHFPFGIERSSESCLWRD